jgi:hypothetical protein
MNEKDLHLAKNKVIPASLIAMKRAAVMARELAVQTNMAIAIPTQKHLFLTCFKNTLDCVTNARNTSGICCALCLAIVLLKPAINRCS